MQSDYIRNLPMLPNLGVGLGLRAEIAEETFSNIKKIDWLEFTPENYMNCDAASLKRLEFAASKVPLVAHGVCLSIGGTDPLSDTYLSNLKTLLDTFEVPWFSDHICFTSSKGVHIDDLLPVPLTVAAAKNIIERVNRVRDFIGRPILLENITYYVDMPGAELSEPEFISLILDGADCGMLLDLNNVYINSINLGFDSKNYLKQLPLERVTQIHMAGHAVTEKYISDTHSAPIAEPVYELLRYVLEKQKIKAVMIERDQAFEGIDGLLAEIDEIRKLMSETEVLQQHDAFLRNSDKRQLSLSSIPGGDLRKAGDIMDSFCTYILRPDSSAAGQGTVTSSQMDAALASVDIERAAIYQEAARIKTQRLAGDIYPACAKLIGDRFATVVSDYLGLYPPRSFVHTDNFANLPEYFSNPVNNELVVQYPFLIELAMFEWLRSERCKAMYIEQKPIEFTSPGDLELWAPNVNPSLILKEFRFPVQLLSSQIMNSQLDTTSDTSPSNLAFCLSPESQFRGVVALTPMASAIVRIAMNNKLSYTQICKIALAQYHDENADPSDVIATLLRLIDTLRNSYIFIDSKVAD